MAYISLQDVSVQFPIRHRGKLSVQKALNGISLELTSGSKLGILGPNGAGKTTLLRVLTGIYPPTSGSIKIDGEVGSMLDLQAGINGKSSGRDNIIFRSKLLGRSRQLAKQTVEDACEFGELAEFIDQPVENYSAGMRMRLAFSIATAVPTQILIMDEWLSVGDKTFQQKAQQRINSLVNQAEILVMASHNEQLLSRLCTSFLKLERGQATYSDKI